MGREWKDQRREKVQRLLQTLFEVVAELNKEFAADRRKFTLDGHLVGSIGEVVAAYAFDLDLLSSSSAKHDARSKDGRLVQIKLTGGDSVGLYSQPDHLIVLQLARNGIDLIYNGPGEPVWSSCGKIAKNGQRRIGLNKLRKLNDRATAEIRQVREFPQLAEP